MYLETFRLQHYVTSRRKFNSVQNLSKTTDFVLIQYNVHSLINFEERMQRVLYEFEGRHWDAVAFAEIWRSECDEAWKTRWGHSWFGSGGTRGTRGVGLLLHGRWTHALFRPVSERLCVLDDDDDQTLDTEVKEEHNLSNGASCMTTFLLDVLLLSRYVLVTDGGERTFRWIPFFSFAADGCVTKMFSFRFQTNCCQWTSTHCSRDD